MNAALQQLQHYAPIRAMSDVISQLSSELESMREALRVARADADLWENRYWTAAESRTCGTCGELLRDAEDAA